VYLSRLRNVCVCVSVKRGIQQVVSFHQVSGEALLLYAPPQPSRRPVGRASSRRRGGDGWSWSPPASLFLRPLRPSPPPATTNCYSSSSFLTACESSSPPHLVISLGHQFIHKSLRASFLHHQFQAAGRGEPAGSECVCVCVCVCVGQCPSIKSY